MFGDYQLFKTKLLGLIIKAKDAPGIQAEMVDFQKKLAGEPSEEQLHQYWLTLGDFANQLSRAGITLFRSNPDPTPEVQAVPPALVQAQPEVLKEPVKIGVMPLPAPIKPPPLEDVFVILSPTKLELLDIITKNGKMLQAKHHEFSEASKFGIDSVDMLRTSLAGKESWLLHIQGPNYTKRCGMMKMLIEKKGGFCHVSGTPDEAVKEIKAIFG